MKVGILGAGMGHQVIRMIMAAEILSVRPGKMSGLQPIEERVSDAAKRGALQELKINPGHHVFSCNTLSGEVEMMHPESYKGSVYITARPPYIYNSSINLDNAKRKFKKIMDSNAGFNKAV